MASWRFASASLKAAIPLLETALGANPGNGQYWANYVDALIQSGQLKAAWIALEMGQQHGMTGPVAENLISLMSTLSNDTDAKAAATSALRYLPRGPAAPAAATPKLTPAESAKTSGQPNQEVIAEPRPASISKTAVALFNVRALQRSRKPCTRVVEGSSRSIRNRLEGARHFALPTSDRYAEAVSAFHARQRAELSPRDSEVLHISATVLEADGQARGSGTRLPGVPRECPRTTRRRCAFSASS